MALDTQIPLLVKSAPIQTPEQVAIARMTIDEAKAKRQEIIDQSADRAALTSALSTHVGQNGLPDYEGALSSLTGHPRAQMQLQNQIATMREAGAKQHAEELKAQTEEAAYVAQMFQGVNDPATWQSSYQRLQKFDPQGAQQIGPDYAPEKVRHLVNAGTSVAEFNKKEKDAQEDLISGKFERGAASTLSLASSPEDWQNRLHQIATYAPKSVVEKWANTPFSPEAVKAAQIAALTPEQQVTREDKIADNKRADDVERRQEARAADLTKIEQQRLGIEGMNAQTNRMRENREGVAAKAALNPTGPPSAAIAEYVKNVQNGTWQISNVPLKERDAVAAYLNQSGQTTAHMTAADWGMKTQATQMLPMIDKTQELAKKIDQMGLTGTINGRWRQIVAHESLGPLTGLTPEQRAVVGEFASQSGLLITGLARAHGGARAGGSPQMVAELKTYLDAGNKDFDTFRGNLNGARNFMNTYAHMGEPSPKTETGGGGGGTTKRVSQNGHEFEVTYDANGKVTGSKLIK